MHIRARARTHTYTHARERARRNTQHTVTVFNLCAQESMSRFVYAESSSNHDLHDWKRAMYQSVPYACCHNRHFSTWSTPFGCRSVCLFSSFTSVNVEFGLNEMQVNTVLEMSISIVPSRLTNLQNIFMDRSATRLLSTDTLNEKFQIQLVITPATVPWHRSAGSTWNTDPASLGIWQDNHSNTSLNLVLNPALPHSKQTPYK